MANSDTDGPHKGQPPIKKLAFTKQSTLDQKETSFNPQHESFLKPQETPIKARIKE